MIRKRKVSDGSQHEETLPAKLKQDYQRQHVKRAGNKKVLATGVLLTLLAVVSRFAFIGHPDQVVFDEVHFGKFASYYLRGTYYFDVHPPLGKLLFALVGYLAGFDGSFLFDKIGDDYVSKNVPYMAMRGFPALLGSLLSPVVFGILYASEHTLAASFLGGLMVIIENSLLTQQRLILLDSFLLFFDVFSVFAWIMFYRQRTRPFGFGWWTWLLITGVSIAFATGVKMVGLFVVALIGFSTIHDLWRLIDYRRGLSLSDVLKHFFARVFGLILVPFVTYLAFFAIHFAVLPKSGPGDTFMSPAFQATLAGSKMNKESFGLIYGANVTIMHYQTSVFLHSHPHNYPLRYDDDRISSQGQQVTGYPHEDSNNIWIFHPEDGKFFETVDGKEVPRPVRHNDVFRLLHLTTNNFMLTHDVASPLTPTHQEVTCVSNDKTDRYNETLFRILLDNGKDEDQISSIDSQFQIQHLPTKVCLHSHKGKYGDWGFGQQEVNGNKAMNDKNNKWIIQNIQSKHELKKSRGKFSESRPGLMRKFFELQAAMISHNAGLTGSHPFQSTPWTWPVLTRGISYWVNNKDRQIYLIGNPVMWWLCSASLLVLCFVYVLDLIMTRRGLFYNREFSAFRRRLQMTGLFFFAGWALHYLPFFVMGRSLFLHHYLPAVVYASLIFCHLLDLALRDQPGLVRWSIVLAFVAVFTYGFYLFLPFTFGMQTVPTQVASLQWMPTWDFSYKG